MSALASENEIWNKICNKNLFRASLNDVYLFMCLIPLLSINEQLSLCKTARSQVPLLKHIKILRKIFVERVPIKDKLRYNPKALNIVVQSSKQMKQINQSKRFAFVETLEMEYKNSAPAPQTWPTKLKYLIFWNTYDWKLWGLPAGLLSLTLHYDFNEILKNLPASLESLKVGDHYKKSFANYLPVGLKTLDVGYYYKDYPELLPKNLPNCHINIRESRRNFARESFPRTIFPGEGRIIYSNWTSN